MKTLRLKSTEKEDIKKAAEILKNGGLAAIPTETVYGLSLIHISEPTRP